MLRSKKTLEKNKVFDQKLYIIESKKKIDVKCNPSINTVGAFRSRGGFYWEQISPEVIVHVIVKGSGIFMIDNYQIPAEQGSVVIFWPGQHIRYWDYLGTPWEYLWVSINVDRNGWYLKTAGIDQQKSIFYPDCFLEIARLLDDVIKVIANHGYSEIYPIRTALSLFDLLSIRTTKSRAPETLPVKAKQLIDHDYLSFPLIDNIAEKLQIDRSTLFRVFKRRYGTSVKEYVDEIRFQKACSLLILPDTRIKEVSYACGFNDQRYFSRAFKKRFGMAPSEWRVARNR